MTGADTPREALVVEGLVKTFGSGEGMVRALDGIDLTLAAGTFTAVMGPSGSGKSTFLNCIAGLDAPTSGVVRVAERDITAWDEDKRTKFRRFHIGMVFQSFQLLPYLSAAQNVELPLRLAATRRDRAWIEELLTRVDLGGRADRLPSELSGGQQQRVAIARALVTRPEMVLADEPTGALDSSTAKDVLGLLRRCVDDLKQTVVMVTHDSVAASYADAVVFLVDGRVVGTMHRPTAEAVAGQMAHLDDLVGTYANTTSGGVRS